MSARFHQKWHRCNHHTYTNNNNPDAGHDPIASQPQPFLGEFVLSGALSAVAPLSAYAAHFYSNNTAICAIGGMQGIYVTGTADAIQAFSENIAISAYSPKLGMSIASSTRAISANAGFIGLDIFSSNKAISARGLLIGLEVSSPMRAISAYSQFIGGEFYANNIAISAFGIINGLKVESPQRAILANGTNIGIDVFSNNTAISANGLNLGIEVFSNNRAISAFGKNIAGEFSSNKIALSAYGIINGLKVESPQIAILANGSNIGLEVFSNNRGISANGLNIGGEFYSTNIPLSTAFGKNLLHGVVGINTNTPTSALEVVGDTVLYGNERITGNVRIDQDLTIYGNLSTLGSISYLDTHVTVTSAMDITNIGTGPALTVTQTGEQPVAIFYDELGHPALYVEGTASKPGWVGIGNSNPSVALSVTGSISALSSLYINQTATIAGNLSAFGDARFAQNLAQGLYTIANGGYSISTGESTIASGYCSHAEGVGSLASGHYSHAEGSGTKAFGNFSHAEGSGSIAEGNNCHAEGWETKALGYFSHAEGVGSIAFGETSHAEGFGSTAQHDYTFIWSDGTTGTNTQSVSTTRTGQFMVSASGGTFIAGNLGIGTDLNTDRLSVGGNTTIYGSLSTTGNTIFSGNLSAMSLFTPVISTQDIKSYGGNGINIKTTSDALIANFGNDGNTTINGTLALPVSSSITNNIVLDFSKNSYVICPIYTTTTISFSSIAAGKTIKAILSSIVASPQTLDPDSRFIYVGAGRPTTLAASKVGYLQIESFGTTISSVIINYFAQN